MGSGGDPASESSGPLIAKDSKGWNTTKSILTGVGLVAGAVGVVAAVVVVAPVAAATAAVAATVGTVAGIVGFGAAVGSALINLAQGNNLEAMLDLGEGGFGAIGLAVKNPKAAIVMGVIGLLAGLGRIIFGKWKTGAEKVNSDAPPNPAPAIEQKQEALKEKEKPQIEIIETIEMEPIYITGGTADSAPSSGGGQPAEIPRPDEGADETMPENLTVRAMTREEVIDTDWSADAELTDLRTGITFKIAGKRPVGYSHSDFQTKTPADTEKLRAAAGRTPSWAARPALWKFNGHESAVSYHSFNHSIVVASGDNIISGPTLKRSVYLPKINPKDKNEKRVWDPATLGPGFERDINGNWVPGHHFCMHYIDTYDYDKTKSANYKKMNEAVKEAVILANKNKI